MKRNKKRRHLRPLKLKVRSKEFYVFDIETGIRKNGKTKYFLSARPEHFVFGVIYGNGFTKVIESVDEFKKEFLKRRYKNKLVYAHNAEYDLSGIYGNIYKLDPEALFNGKFISCKNGNCTFVDSRNLLPTSVENLGELLGIKKQELGENFESDNFAKDVEYCIRDCEIIYKSLEKIFDGVEPSFTIGSLSLKLFRSQYLKKTIKINEHADEFFACLYGGRTEAFYIGACKGYVYDINSAYPYVMKYGRFPNPALLRELNKPESMNMNSLRDLMRNYGGMIDATVSVSPSEKIPALPFRTTDRLIFPCGVFRGCWTMPEFAHALEFTDTVVINVHKIIYAPLIESPFAEFINTLWKLRAQTTNEFERYYYKLYMNNLYGKMIQRAREEYRFCESTKECYKVMDSKKLRRCEFIKVTGGYFMRYDLDKIFSHTIAPWGAYITSYVRCLLHIKMKQFENNLLYCDTDSIFLDRSLVMNDKDLGGWKREEKIITKIRALKDYVYYEDGETLRMLKGVKKNAKQLTPDADVFQFQRMIKTRESMRRTDDLPPGTFIDQTKVLSGDYSKRKVFKDGTTKPFIL